MCAPHKLYSFYTELMRIFKGEVFFLDFHGFVIIFVTKSFALQKQTISKTKLHKRHGIIHTANKSIFFGKF